MAPIETSLPAAAGQAGALVPVQLQAVVTAVGTLELRCLERDGAGRWQLELNVRMKETSDGAAVRGRDRSRHLELRPRLRRPGGGPRCRGAGFPGAPGGAARRDGRARRAAVVPVPASPRRMGAGRGAAAVGRGPDGGGWGVRPLAGRAGSRTAGQLGEELAVPCGGGSRRPSFPGVRRPQSWVSPVDASARYLGHLAAAWNVAHPDAPLARQELVITVPASFDAVARALTERAARAAGLEGFTLVEEPEAAFGEFVARHRDCLDRALAGVRLVLVVDVGGGTTDFTLIRVDAAAGGPELRRVAVGDHLMLGGDNMDAAVARLAEQRIASDGRRLGAASWAQWVQGCRRPRRRCSGTLHRRSNT